MTRVIGCDLGITRAAPTALALYELETDRVIDIRVIQPARDADSADERIGAIALEVSRYLDSTPEPPLALAYEMSHFQLNAQTALKLAKLAGALVCVATLHDIEPQEIQPAQGKNALAGYDKADKAMMINAARVQYGRHGLSSHEADAIGVALAGAAILRRAMLEERIEERRR